MKNYVLLLLFSVFICTSCDVSSKLKYEAKLQAKYRDKYRTEAQKDFAAHAKTIADSISRVKDYKIDSLRSEVDSLKEELFLASQKKFTAVPQDSLIRIRFANLIAGYRVSVLWQPEYIGHWGAIIGKAIINFKSKNDSFSIVHSMFFLPYNIGFTMHDEEIKFDPSRLYEFEYPDAELTSLKEVGLPFFFMDNRNTLVLTMIAQGQRDINAYQFLARDGGGNLSFEQGTLYQITNEEPFNNIDEWTYINNDTIVTYSNGGAFHNTWRYYKKNKYERGYSLYKIAEHTDDTVRIYKPAQRLIKKKLYDTEKEYDIFAE